MQTEKIKEFAKAKSKDIGNKGFQLIKACDLVVKKPIFLVHNLMEDDSMGLMFGDSESYKTFLAVDVALSVATGTPFHGRKILKTGPVAYIIGEGRSGFSRRCLAWSINKGLDYHDAPFYVSTMPASFLHVDSVKQVADAINEIEPVLIVIDTLARNYGPGDENSTADMNKFISALDNIRRPHKATALIIHHTGHGEKDRSRGAYALKCALDFEYKVKREHSGTVILESTKMKDAEKPEPMAFEPQVIKMFDDDGQPMSSLVFEATEMPEQQTGKNCLSPAQRIALDALSRLFNKRDTVHIDEWRKECYSAGISDSPEGKKKAFKRARISLIDKGLVSTRDDFYWIGDKGGQQRDMSPNVPGYRGTDRDTLL